MTESEIIANSEQEERELKTRPVSIWVFRHFTPHPKYREDKPLVLGKAKSEATEAVKTLISNVGNGEPIIFYGAGTKGRHQESYKLLKEALVQKIKESKREINVVEPRVAKRPSLRPVEFWHYQEIPEALGREMDYWLKTDETLGKKIESTEQVFDRFRKLLKGLTRFTKRQLGGERVHWVLITSGEVLAPEMVEHFGPKWKRRLGIGPGCWIRIDVAQGEFTGTVELTHYKGIKKKISLTSKNED